MRLTPAMTADIDRVTHLLGGHTPAGPVTATVRDLTAAPRTTTSAVYVAWDVYGRCRYVGSVYRPADRRAVRDRMTEHLRQRQRRENWYAVTVFALHPDVTEADVRQCEGWAAYALDPLEGSAHPVPRLEARAAAA
jgi:hypothetical protein